MGNFLGLSMSMMGKFHLFLVYIYVDVAVESIWRTPSTSATSGASVRDPASFVTSVTL